MRCLHVGGFFNKDPDGVSFKAALLSGAPGVGKTTTSTLVCQELGFSYVEMNASDQRSKKILEHSLASSTSSKTMDEYGKGLWDFLQNFFYKDIMYRSIRNLNIPLGHPRAFDLLKSLQLVKFPAMGQGSWSNARPCGWICAQMSPSRGQRK